LVRVPMYWMALMALTVSAVVLKAPSGKSVRA
jgi:hypothetical protein